MSRPGYQSFWGDRFALASDQNTKTRFDNDRSGYRIATSVSGAATGEGGDRVVCDDPHNVQEAESDSVRKATIDWYDLLMSTRVNDPEDGGEGWCRDAALPSTRSERAFAGKGGWEHLCLPAEYEDPPRVVSIRFPDPRSQPGELLWQAQFGPREIADLKVSMGSYASAGQPQQRPSPAGGGVLKRHWFRFWQPSGKEYPPVAVRMPDGSIRFETAHVIDHVEEMMQSWDCSFKDLQTSDFEFVRQAWRVIEPHTPFVPGWHIDAIITTEAVDARRSAP